MIFKVVWITSNEARVFEMSGQESLTPHVMKPHGPRHQTETLGRNHPQSADDTERFIHEVAEYLAHAPESKVLIVGPAQAKLRLKNQISSKYPHFESSIVGTETVDKLTDAQILAFARKYFKRFNTFETPISSHL